MSKSSILLFGFFFILLLQGIMVAQYPVKEDVVWARTAPATMKEKRKNALPRG